MDIKTYKYKNKKKDLPPKTIRFCGNCVKETIWKYEPSIGHSQCEECGYRKLYNKCSAKADYMINYTGKIIKI